MYKYIGVICLFAFQLAAGEENKVASLAKRTNGHDWPQILGPNQNNKSAETGINKTWKNKTPRLVWEMTTGEGYAAPSISAGRVFIFDRIKNEARLTCAHAETGKVLWRNTYPTEYEDMYGYSNGPRSAPLIQGERVYSFGSDGMLRCNSVQDGALLWQVNTTANYGVVKNFFGVGASPVLYQDLLIAQIGGSPKGTAAKISRETKGNGTGIVAFDKKTGKEVYRLSNELAGYATPRLVQGTDRDWCFTFARGGLLAFNPKNGEQDFHFPWQSKRFESVNAATPVVVDDLVLITESYGLGSALLSFRPGAYEVVRKDKSPRDLTLAAHWTTPVVHNGYLYGSHGSGGRSDLRCVELRTGKLAWRKTGLVHAGVLYVDGHLVVTTEKGDVRLVEASPEAYREVGHLKDMVDRPAYNGPVLAQGLLYLLGNTKLKCLELIPTN